MNCRSHQWNTRHNEAKYITHAQNLSTLIKLANPSTIVLFNQLPKKWYKKNIYFQLIPNEDDEREVFDILPRLGAFEVSTVNSRGRRSMDILFFSKLLSNSWPKLKTLAVKVSKYIHEQRQRRQETDAFVPVDVQDLKHRYQT